ncbi:hypothetical protein [Rheinheimera sp. NSM]|uniref:hypothetical protein n=1 Tax=Rheinheimera sp. NSM TaxID=3457884 RepID=UPI004036B383
MTRESGSRQQLQHQAAQQQGRSGLFAHYRLRVATVMRDYGLNDRRQAPEFISL